MQIPCDFLREAERLFARLRPKFQARLANAAATSHVLATFDLQGITLAVTDGEHWLETFRAAIPEPGGRCAFLIPPRAMAAACRGERGGVVEFTPGGTFTRRELRVEVRHGRGRLQSVHPTGAAEAFPACPPVAGDSSLVAARTMQSLALVAACAATGERHPILNGVCFTPVDGGRLIATDGWRHACLPAVVPPQAFVLPNAAVRVLSHPGFRGFENEITLAGGGGATHAMFRCWDHLLVAKLRPGGYPAVDPALPTGADAWATLDGARRATVIHWLRSLPDPRTPVRLVCQNRGPAGHPGELALSQRSRDGGMATLRVAAALRGCLPQAAFRPRDLADALAIGPALGLGDGRGPAVCRDSGGGVCLLAPLPAEAESGGPADPPWLAPWLERSAAA